MTEPSGAETTDAAVPVADGSRTALTRGARLKDVDLGDAVITGISLRGAVLRSADLDGAQVDSPWLVDPGTTFLVNDVDVAQYVESQLCQRFPGRSLRLSESPDELRAAWGALQAAWGAAIDRASAMPPGTVDESVAGEWSFAETLRHLVMATDVWLRRAILDEPNPYHPIGKANEEFATDGNDTSVFSEPSPSFDRVLEVRAEHVAQVGDFLATVTADQLREQRPNPWAPEYPETVLSCLHTILHEEWEHLRFATRDLDALEHTDDEAVRADSQ